MKKLYTIIFFLALHNLMFSVNYSMTNGVQTISCPGPHNFYDSGGSGGGGAYGNNENLTMTFVAGTAGQCLQISFSGFNTESGYDELEVYDGATTGSPLLGIYSGTSLPPTLTSSSGTLTFRFTSDGSVTNPGWAASISCVTCPPPPPPSYLMSNTAVSISCPGTYLFHDSGGSGGNYASSENFTKTFTASGGNCLQFVFTSFSTESCCDRLYIYDGPNGSSPLIGTYAGSSSPGTIISSGSSVTFSFTSDGSVVNSGWTASVSCVAPCAGVPTAGTASAAASSVCGAGGTVALSATGSSTGCGLTYQWESASSAAGPWTSISGATAASYTATVPSAMCFQRVIMCGVSSATTAAVCVSIGSCSTQLGSGVVNVGSALPYTTSGTTCGSGNDLTTSNVSTSGCSSSSYLTGEDQVFMFTPSTSGNVTINLTSGGSYTGLMLYSSCPLQCASSTGCVASATGSSGNKSLTYCVTAGTTYYLILDSFSTPFCNAYSNLSISSPNAPSGTSNDVCAAAAPLTAAGTYTSLTTNYTPDTPGNINSVFCGSIENNQWFTFTATSATATFSFNNITGCTGGIQAQVFSVSTSTGVCSTCNSFTSVSSPCYYPGNTTAGSVVATGLTVGNTYYLMVDGNGGAACNFQLNGWSAPTLPVDLISFGGQNYSESINKLDWTVAQEKNLDYYLVQRSFEGTKFTDLDKVYANNSTQSEKSYSYYDKSFTESLNYYRLKIVDKDLAFKYSPLVALSSSKEDKFRVNKIFPNPANAELFASVDAPDDGLLEFDIIDFMGRVIYSDKQNLRPGANIVGINLESFRKGIYYLKFKFANEVKVEKFSLQ
jgi:hypothetical protein